MKIFTKWLIHTGAIASMRKLERPLGKRKPVSLLFSLPLHVYLFLIKIDRMWNMSARCGCWDAIERYKEMRKRFWENENSSLWYSGNKILLSQNTLIKIFLFPEDENNFGRTHFSRYMTIIIVDNTNLSQKNKWEY